MKKTWHHGKPPTAGGIPKVLREQTRRLTDLFATGGFVEVETRARALLKQYPTWGFGWKVLGASQAMQQRYEEAIAAYVKALSLMPGDAETYKNLGNALSETGRLEDAITHYDTATGLMPDDAEVYFRLGTLLQHQGRFAESKDRYTRATELKPDYGEAYFGLGNVLYAERRYSDAAEKYRRTIELIPEHVFAHNNLGAVLLAQRNIPEAITHLQKALVLKPDYAEAWNNMGNALREVGRPVEAVAAFERTLKLSPDHVNALPLSLHLKQQLCHDWSGLTTSVAHLQQGLRAGRISGLVPFPLLALPILDSADHRAAAVSFVEGEFGAQFARPPAGPSGDAHRGRLRIGYLSQDFRTHAVSQLVVGVLERHDRTVVEVTGYSYGKDDGSPIRTRIQRACEHFCDVHELPDESIARLIADDGIDILIDLTGFTSNARPAILAYRPAPLQVNWLGYPGTLGHPRMADYLIGDPCVTPPGHANGYSETLALLPHCYQPNSPVEAVLPAPSRRAEGLPESGVVFCNVNQCAKITPDVFDIWCRVLRDVPDSVIWLLRPEHDVAAKNLCREADNRGVRPGRMLFAERKPLAQHLSRLQLADICLDTFPYTSHTTGSDILRAGVPLITRIGETFASRVAASLLTTIGVPELVADTWEKYTDIALKLARNPDELAALKRKVAAQRQTSPLFDTDRFTRNLERLYQRMWDDYRSGKKDMLVPGTG